MKFEKLHQLKKGKHAITAACLALGVTMLTTAVYASYDDANGYKNYKEAVKQLVFDERNVTADMHLKLEIDGEEVMSGSSLIAVDKNNYHEIEKSAILGEEDYNRDWRRVEKNGKLYIIDDTDKTYEVEDIGLIDYERQGLFNVGVDRNDPTTKKIIRFVELLGDAFVGDIKNNVVLESKEDGVRNYTVSASEVQIPELINAGVAVAFGTLNGSYSDYVTTRYVDYDATRKNYYKQRTGKDLPDNFYDSDDYDAIQEVLDELYDKEDEMRAGKEHGVIVVYKDASMQYYANMQDAMDDPKNEGAFHSDDFLSKYVGGDAWIKSGTNNFSIDEDGRLLRSEGNVVIISEDMDGRQHEIKIIVKTEFRDYETTRIDIPDLKDYKEQEEDKVTYEEPDVDDVVLTKEEAKLED